MTPAPIAQLALYLALGAIAVPLGYQAVRGVGLAARAIARRVRMATTTAREGA